ncbi:MAG: bacteriophage abortive infection AbiH family protein [Cyclobacteriaceae bacterium]
MDKGALNNTLYIIGNGFDLHHKLDTWYSSFGLFLQEHHNDIYEVFMEYYGFGDLDKEDEESLKDPMWWEFEASLAQIDGDLLLENHSEHTPNYGSDDYRDRDLYDIQIYIENIVDKATLKMRLAFEEFINNVIFPEIEDKDLANLNKDALFLTFNYTDTLERYYNVGRENIEYIHHKAGEKEDLILGHGIDPKEFVKQEEQPPSDPEERERWEEWMADQYDYSIERGKDEVRAYFQKSFKPTQDVIIQKEAFFNRINQVDNIYVLGHSLAEVDLPYFREIAKHISKDTHWFVSYFRESEIANRKAVVMSLGIDESKIHLTTISDL